MIFFLLGTSVNAQNTRRLRIRRPCSVLSPCNVANTVNECRLCGMTCIAWRRWFPTGYCFPVFRRDHVEDDFNEDREDFIKYDLSKGRHSGRDSFEDDSKEGGCVQDSLEDDSKEGGYGQDSLEDNSNEEGCVQDSLEDDSNEGGYVQDSLKDNSNEGGYLQDSLEDDSNEGGYGQDSLKE